MVIIFLYYLLRMGKQAMQHSVIHDGDHGSDDFVATLLFAAQPRIFNLLGVTTGYGNTSVEHATRNALAALELAGRHNIPVCSGSKRPLSVLKSGDNAFDDDGLGGVSFPVCREPHSLNAVEWMAETLRVADRPVTLCATGLMTNMARLLQTCPDVVPKIGRIVAMGGCLGPLEPGGRRGNITPYAEFNFYMDPDAADIVLNSGVPVTLLPMDATHKTVLTPERQKRLLDLLPEFPARELVRMMRAAEKYDMPKFGLPGAVLHDQNVPLFLMAPHLYEGRDVTMTVNADPADERHGQMTLASEGGPVHMIERIADPEAVFQLMAKALAALFPH